MIGNKTMLATGHAKHPRSESRGAVGALLAVAGFLMLAATAVAAMPSPAAAPAGTMPAATIEEEEARLREAMRQEIAALVTDSPESEQAWVALTEAVLAARGDRIDRPQLLVVVDRNPRVQQMRLVLARPDGPWQSLGGAKVSTGQPGRFEHFLTPTGVFRHTEAILDWRAEGTRNEHNVRGLGVEGMRVWDFGWQQAVKGWGPSGVGRMRLLLHATDPATLERRIGRAASNGCIRLPTAVDRFLDAHGVLDFDYERAARRKPRFAALLLPERIPTPLAGDRLVVIDSAEPTGASPGSAGAQAPAATTEVRPNARPATHKTAKRSSKPHHLTRSRHRHGRAMLAVR